jgi:competence protein ComEC
MQTLPLIATGVIALVTIMLMHPVRRRLTDIQTWGLIMVAMLCCGITAGTRGYITHLLSGSGGLHEGPVIQIGKRMQDAIDSIPFSGQETGAIIKALLTGERSSLSGTTTAAFRASGASHILALSGLHLGVIYGLAGTLLSVIGNSAAARRVRSVIIVSVCGLYTVATGAGASICRAFIFILLGETALITGRHRNLKTIMMASLLIHLTISPQSARDIGFQLSYAAIAGIAFIFPWLKGFWPESGSGKGSPLLGFKPLRWVWNSAALSISCQLSTGPIAWICFGTFPRHFPLTNLIAIPLTGIIIPAALLTLCLSSAGICPVMLLRATETLVTALSEALRTISLM